jgi:hypothetical protein
MAQVVECLPSKYKAWSSNHTTVKNKTKQTVPLNNVKKKGGGELPGTSS